MIKNKTKSVKINKKQKQISLWWTVGTNDFVKHGTK
jgi:hypothetical protein